MTNREVYFSLTKLNNGFLPNTAIKSILIDVGGYNDFFDLLKHFDESIKDENKLNNYVERVKNGEPLQYVLGYAFFINSNYKVTPDVLIPRQETEQLAIGALTYIYKVFGKNPNISLVDVGTGSGILGIYLKEKLPNIDVTETDISQKSLEIAIENAKNHNVSINFLKGDMLKPIIDNKLHFDVLISNPPYILDESTVNSQVLKYEPHLALFANPDTKYYEHFFKNASLFLNKKYLMAFEIGENMEDKLTSLIEEILPGVLYSFEKDLYNKTRFLYIINTGEKIDA